MKWRRKSHLAPNLLYSGGAGSFGLQWSNFNFIWKFRSGTEYRVHQVSLLSIWLFSNSSWNFEIVHKRITCDYITHYTVFEWDRNSLYKFSWKWQGDHQNGHYLKAQPGSNILVHRLHCMGEDQYSMTARSMEKLASSLHLSKESVNSNWASVNESHSAHMSGLSYCKIWHMQYNARCSVTCRLDGY